MRTETQSAALRVIGEFYDAEAAYLPAGGGDFSDIAATLDRECVIFQPASLPYGGEWRGHDGFEGWMKAFVLQWSAMEVADSEFYGDGDVVVSKSRVSAHRSSPNSIGMSKKKRIGRVRRILRRALFGSIVVERRSAGPLHFPQRTLRCVF